MRPLRPLRASAILVALAASVAGCASTGASSSNSTGGASGAKPAAIDLGHYCDQTCAAALALHAAQSKISCRVAFLDDATSFPYGATQFQLAKSYAAKYFPNMSLEVLNGNNDPTNQSSQLDTVTAQGYKVVILDPVVADALVPAVKRATARGVKIVDIDRTVNAPVLSTIKAPDTPLGGRAAEFIAQQLHGQGTVAILSGTPGASPTIDRTNGFNAVIKKYPGIHVVANVNGNYTTDQGYTAVSNLLTRYPKTTLNWIFSEADAMSLGAIKAIQGAGRGADVKISGIDGQQEGFTAIQQGTYAGTVVYPLVQPEGVVAAAKACAGESLPASIQLSYPLVTKDNVATYFGSTFS
jgi:ribose transport system substrate-binding protein